MERKVQLNGLWRNLYDEKEIECFDAIFEVVEPLENYITGWSICFLGREDAYVEFTTGDGQGEFIVFFDTEDYGRVKNIKTTFSSQKVTYDFIELAKELYSLYK